jgi:hypothetical protein
MEYRIKIEEKNNGEKRYIPQVGKPLLKIGKFDFLSINWENIISQPPYFFTAKSITYSYPTEKEALGIIEEYKQYVQEEEGKEVNSTTYKTIE